jgi:hypothetical protein
MTMKNTNSEYAMPTRNCKFAILLMSCLLSVSTIHAGTMRSLEDALEASSDSVTFPATDAGTLYFNDCQACNKSALQLSVATKFIVNEQSVSFADFKNALAKRGSHYMTILYTPTDHVVTRVKLTVANVQ